jgi:hypothetical protein
MDMGYIYIIIISTDFSHGLSGQIRDFNFQPLYTGGALEVQDAAINFGETRAMHVSAYDTQLHSGLLVRPAPSPAGLRASVPSKLARATAPRACCHYGRRHLVDLLADASSAVGDQSSKHFMVKSIKKHGLKEPSASATEGKTTIEKKGVKGVVGKKKEIKPSSFTAALAASTTQTAGAGREHALRSLRNARAHAHA